VIVVVVPDLETVKLTTSSSFTAIVYTFGAAGMVIVTLSSAAVLV
jgi:hypothetical protein